MMATSERIAAAFAGVPKPGSIRAIAPHSCPECDALGSYLLPYEFTSLPGPIIAAHFDSLPLLGPAALHHFLPAFLMYALSHPESDVMRFTIYHLSPSRKARANAEVYFDERFRLFTDEQRRAIGAFFADVLNYQLFVGSEGELDRAAILWPYQA